MAQRLGDVFDRRREWFDLVAKNGEGESGLRVMGTLLDPVGHTVTLGSPHAGLIVVEYHDGASLGPVEECFFVEDGMEKGWEQVDEFVDHLLAGRIEVHQVAVPRGCLGMLAFFRTRQTTLRYVDSIASPGHVVYRTLEDIGGDG